MSTIYLVLAESGEYANHQEWAVVAYSTLDGASKCIERFYNWMSLQGAEKYSTGWCALGFSHAERVKLGMEFKAQFGIYLSIDTNGVRWREAEIQLLEDA